MVSLLSLLEKNPGNSLLRLTIIRKLIEAGEKSKALSLALDLSDEACLEKSDHAMLEALFDEAGLVGHITKWQTNSEQTIAPDKLEVSSEKTENTSLKELEQATGAESNTVSGLRVVGGTDNTEIESVGLDQQKKTITFEDVGGLDDVKKDIKRKIIAPFMQKSLISRFKKRVGGGILLYGPPGCGKTLIARATAGECGVPFQAISIPDILDPMSGISEKKLSRLFENARNNTPGIIFFDEIDALAAKRSATTATHTAQLASHFLNELDGVDCSNEGLLILAATNVPWLMDSAFLRPGRFDRLFFTPPPDKIARERIFELELADCPLAGDIKPQLLAKYSSGFSGADIRNVVERAADLAIDETLEIGKEIPVSQAMLMETIKGAHSSVADWLTTAKNYATYSNESGRYNEILAFLQKQGRG